MPPKNLFKIGRRRGSEDQLTEMLAFLWERRPELIERWMARVDALEAPAGDWRVATQVVEPGVGRFDMTLVLEGQAFVVVESKLGAELGPGAARTLRRPRGAPTGAHPRRGVAHRAGRTSFA